MDVKIIGQMDNTIDHTFESANRVYDKNGLSPTINTCGGGGLQPKIIDEPKCLNSKGGRGGVEGLQPSVQDRVYSTDAPSIAITTGFMPSILEEPRLQRIDIPQTVKVRKYPVDTENLCELLRHHKANSNLNNNGISNALGVPTTTVEHWFRRDDCFAIPDPEIWMQLKALLQIETDEFDEAIMTFEEKEGVFEKSERHYFEEGLAPTLTSVQQEKVIVAMRGRKPDNPSDRTAGSQTEQRLEPNSQGICNTLTSVQKDNMLLETVKVKQATKDGYIECKVGGVADLSFPDSATRRGRVQDMGDTCPTLMAGESDICRIEKADFIIGGLQEHQTPRTDGASPSLTAAMEMGGGQTPLINQQYRIRKLTPKECWRLMDFSDDDFHKAEQVNSNTQLYKQAGNSIVKNCLVAIFGQMIPDKENIYKKMEESL